MIIFALIIFAIIIFITGVRIGMWLEEENFDIFDFSKESKYAMAHKGDICFFTNNGTKWSKGTLMGFSDGKWKLAEGYGNYVFCYEYQLHIRKMPNGWTDPYLDKNTSAK